ncbi:unnamed protein product [Closterium sp. Naga37s-1]|nr:unnamed protein product [Closterium sp. Naga37s-1]
MGRRGREEEAQRIEAEEAERQQKAKQQEKERLQKEEAQRIEAEEAERQQRAKQQEMERLREEEAQREAERQQSAKQEEMERLREEEAQSKEAEEAERQHSEQEERRQTEAEVAEQEQKREQRRAEKRARLASCAEERRLLEAKAKAMAEETERLAREMEEEDSTMQGEGTGEGVEEEITKSLGRVRLEERGEANVADGVPKVQGQKIEVSRRRPGQEDREPEGHAAKRRRAVATQEFSLVQTNTGADRQQPGDGFRVAACAAVGITAWQKIVGGVDGENGYSTEEHAVGIAATLSVLWDASTNVARTQWETGASSAALKTSTAIATSAANTVSAATASSAATSSSAVAGSSAVLDALAPLAASVACVAVDAMESVKDQEHDKEAWIQPLSDALLSARPAESRTGGDTKRMTRVVAKVVTSWCLCSMASRGLRQHQGVSLVVLQKKLGTRDTTIGADKEKKTKKSAAKGNATKGASTEGNTSTGGQE